MVGYTQATAARLVAALTAAATAARDELHGMHGASAPRRSRCEGARRSRCEGARRSRCEGARRSRCEGARRSRCERESGAKKPGRRNPQGKARERDASLAFESREKGDKWREDGALSRREANAVKRAKVAPCVGAKKACTSGCTFDARQIPRVNVQPLAAAQRSRTPSMAWSSPRSPGSVLSRLVILSTAEITVVWCLPPKPRPRSG